MFICDVAVFIKPTTPPPPPPPPLPFAPLDDEQFADAAVVFVAAHVVVADREDVWSGWREGDDAATTGCWF